MKIKYRLYTEEKVSIGFIILSNKVARLINAIETIPRCLAGFYHVKIAKQQLHTTVQYKKRLPLATKTKIEQTSNDTMEEQSEQFQLLSQIGMLLANSTSFPNPSPPTNY